MQLTTQEQPQTVAWGLTFEYFVEMKHMSNCMSKRSSVTFSITMSCNMIPCNHTSHFTRSTMGCLLSDSRALPASESFLPKTRVPPRVPCMGWFNLAVYLLLICVHIAAFYYDLFPSSSMLVLPLEIVAPNIQPQPKWWGFYLLSTCTGRKIIEVYFCVWFFSPIC